MSDHAKRTFSSNKSEFKEELVFMAWDLEKMSYTDDECECQQQDSTAVYKVVNYQLQMWYLDDKGKYPIEAPSGLFVIIATSVNTWTVSLKPTMEKSLYIEDGAEWPEAAGQH